MVVCYGVAVTVCLWIKALRTEAIKIIFDFDSHRTELNFEAENEINNFKKDLLLRYMVRKLAPPLLLTGSYLMQLLCSHTLCRHDSFYLDDIT